MRLAIVVMMVLALAACGQILADPSSSSSGPATVDSPPSGTPTVATSPTTSTTTASPGSSAAVPAAPPGDAGCVAIEHENGAGQVYLSCSSLRTWDEAAAWAACEAFVAGGTGGSCQLRNAGSCVGKAVVSIGVMVRSETNASWDFGTAARGHVSTYPNAAPLGCPSASDPLWD